MKFSRSLGNEKYNAPAGEVSTDIPSLFWHAVWSQKARELGGECPSVIDGYHFISEAQYNELIRRVIAPMNLKAGQSMLECGCGSGAFLKAVDLACPGLKLFGVDYSESMLEAARAKMPGAAFLFGDIRNLSQLKDESFNHSAAFAVLCYLNHMEEARQALDELVRVTKPGGCIFLGDTSDIGKRKEATRLLEEIWRPRGIPDYLFFDRDFFHRYADSQKLTVRIIGMDQPELAWYPLRSLRYSVYLYKSGCL